MTSREGKRPASLIFLTTLLAAALVWLLVVENGVRDRSNPDAGGPLVTVTPDAVIRFEVTTPEETTTLYRVAGHWELSGRKPAGAWQDRADASAAEALVRAVVATTTSPILAGTGAAGTDSSGGGEDYGLTLERAVRVVVGVVGGGTTTLLLGSHNPLTNRIYARGAGRSGVFNLPADPWEKVPLLETAVRLWRLWPAFTRQDVRFVRIHRARLEEELRFQRDPDGTWWIQLPGGPGGGLAAVAGAYDAHYADRRRTAAGVTYWRAEERTLDHLLTRLSECQTVAAGPLPATAAEMQAYGLATPEVEVEVAVGAQSPLEAAFGGKRDDGLVAAARDGRSHVLWVASDVLAALQTSLASYLETDVLSFAWSDVDSFALRRLASGSLRAIRQGDAWRAVLPDSAWSQDPRQVDHLCADLAHHLQRLAIQGVRPPARERHPLRDEGRTRLTVWFTGGVHDQVVEFGELVASGEAAAYFPADGKLLLVSPDWLVSLRALFTTLRL